MSVLRSTLATPAQFAQDVRKSRFLANATSVATPDAAIAFVTAVAHADATHNCWAYRIGQQYRFNDDGEPAGTGGKPILQAIDGQGLDEVVVVVTRWFGGIKLGAGGLMRAYGGAAAECLRNAIRRQLIETADVEFALGFVSLPLLHARLTDFDAHKLSETFVSDGAVLRVRLPTSRIEALRSLLADLSRGQCTMRVLD
ncbi:MAG TPA: YigZ family protein [Rudaea sp.]|nr:YigZ family protein [Rudaea sp.]